MLRRIRPRQQFLVQPTRARRYLSATTDTAQASSDLKLLTRTQAELYNRTLNDLRLALFNKNLQAAWASYTVLKDNGNCHRIGSRQFQSISSFVASLVSKAHDPSTQAQVEQLALAAAVHGSVDGLMAYLRNHLLRGDPHQVLALYTTFFLQREQVQQSTEPEDLSDSNNDKQLHSSSSLLSQSALSDASPADLLTYAVIAAAMLNDFPSTLLNFAKSGVKLSIKNTLSIAAGLPDELKFQHTDIQQAVVRYAQDFELLRLIAHPGAFHRHIQNLVGSSNFSLVHELWIQMKDTIQRPNGLLGAVAASSRPLIVPSQVWISFMLAFSQLRRFDCTQDVWVSAITFGVTLDGQMWNGLLQACCQVGTLLEINGLWERMRKENVVLDVPSYTALIEAIWKSGSPANALKLFEEVFKAYAGPRKNLMALCNTVIKNQLRKADPSHALKLIDDMERVGPSPNQASFNLILNYYRVKGDVKNLIATLESMFAKGVTPDIASFTITLDALLETGRTGAIQTFLKLMTTFKVDPNQATLTIIMNHLLRKGDAESLSAAWDLLIQMESDSDPNRRPNVITYTQLMDAFYSCGQITPQEAITAVEELWRRMQRHRIKPSKITFEVLIKASFRNRNASLAMKYFHQQRNRQISFTDNEFEILLRNLLVLQEYDFARDVVNVITGTVKFASGTLQKYINTVLRHRPGSSL